MADLNGTVEIWGNAAGCNSSGEVEAAYGVGVGESEIDGRQSNELGPKKVMIK